MLRLLPPRLPSLAFLLMLFGCEPSDPIVLVPTDCGFDAPKMAFSDPVQCEPRLTSFTSLHNSIGTIGNLPPLPEDCTASGPAHMAELPGVDDGDFTLHVYNGTGRTLTLSIYGMNGCNEVAAVTNCNTITAIADKVKVAKLPESYTSFFVRFTIGSSPFQSISTPLDADAFVSLAAYDDKEPGSAGSIAYVSEVNSGKTYPDQRVDANGRLPYNCAGTAFQRLVLADCEQDEKVLREWVRRTGLPVSEEYYGPKGNVVVLSFPEGMDLNTGGDGARTQRAEINTGNGGTAEPDYLINLFSPETPGDVGGRLPMFFEDPQVRSLDLNKGYIENLLPPFAPYSKFDPSLPEVRVALIDSGVDSELPNLNLWKPTIYTGVEETEFIKAGNLGFDFINKDFTPDDKTPHGTYVAGAFLNNYQRNNPLQTIHFRIFGEEGIASYFGALVSLYEASAIGSNIINMSWGIAQKNSPLALECAIETVVKNGAYAVTSAGNNNADLDGLPQWPANFSEKYPDRMLAVASFWYGGHGFESDRDPKAVVKKDFSNYSPLFTGVAAYMSASVPSYPGGGAAVYPLGTSISAPVITGRLAEQFTSVPNHALGALLRTFRQADPLDGITRDKLYLPLAPPSTPTP